MTRKEAMAIAEAVAKMIEACSATVSDAIVEHQGSLVEALVKASPTMEVDGE